MDLLDGGHLDEPLGHLRGAAGDRLDPDEADLVAPEEVGVEHGAVVADVALVLQRLRPLVDRRRPHVETTRDLREGRPAVDLEDGEDLPVDLVDIHGTGLRGRIRMCFV